MTLVVQSYSWEAIERHFIEVPTLSPMAQFVRQIRESNYSEGVYAATSVSTLLIAQTPSFDFNRNVLKVKLREGMFDFEYVEGSNPQRKRWRLVVPKHEAFATFERFLTLVNWFL